jgi:hypothetical protein
MMLCSGRYVNGVPIWTNGQEAAGSNLPRVVR